MTERDIDTFVAELRRLSKEDFGADDDATTLRYAAATLLRLMPATSFGFMRVGLKAERIGKGGGEPAHL